MKRRGKKQFNAISMRTILVILVCLMLGALVGGFYYAQDKLKEQSDDVNATLVRLSNTSATQPAVDLSKLQAELEIHRGITEKLNRLYVPSSNLQSQAIQDINRYSQASGVGIGNFTFGPTADNAQLQPNDVTVILRNPVNYDSLIRFMQLVETNLPKMNIQGVSITTSPEGQSVTVRNLIIGVSIR
jgi:Tfp pilus assembly protein PilO